MDRFSPDDMGALVAHTQTPCVSLLMTTTHAGGTQNVAQWKNLHRDAEETLARLGLHGSKAKDILGPAQERSDDSALWGNVSDGLGAFLAPGAHHLYRVPLHLEQQVVVG